MRNLLQADSPDQRTVIGLLRHGKTVWNEAGRIQGLQDSPLSSKGAEQVHHWGAFLQNVTIDRILCSDLGRAQETAAIIKQYIGTVPLESTPVLREQSWGEWEGKTLAELKQHHTKELNEQVDLGWKFRPPGGESRQEVLERVLPFVHELPNRFPEEQVLVICHEGVVKTILYHLAGRAFLPTEKKLIQKRQLHLLQSAGKTVQIGALNVFPKELSKG